MSRMRAKAASFVPSPGDDAPAQRSVPEPLREKILLAPTAALTR
jgi:hypothetical protein